MMRFRRCDWLIAGALVLLTLGLYWRVRHFDFINYDDSDYVVNSWHVHEGLSLDSIIWACTTNAAANWHPLTWLSYMLDVQLFGPRAGPMHLENVLIHCANSALLFLALLAMTHRRWASAWAAGIFAWHPLHVESVAWISERKDVLCALFFMLSLLAYVRYVRRPGVGRYAVVLLAFVMGLLAKPMIITLPCVLLLLDIWPLRRLSDLSLAPSRKIAPDPRKALIVEKLPMFFIAILSSLATYWAQSAGNAIAATASIPIRMRLANAIVSYAQYLRMTFAPYGLAIFYPHPGTYLGGSIPAASIIVSATLLTLISIVALWTRRSMPWILIGWLWYLGTLVPVIGIVQVGSQALADRYMYIPMIGILLAVGWSAASLLEHSWTRPILGALAGGLCIAAMIVSWRQIGYWRDSETIMTRAIAVVPNNYMAHCNLGEVYDSRNDLAGAANEYRTVLQIKPGDAIALLDLGVQAAKRGDFDEALDLYQRAQRANPGWAPAYTNYGSLLSKLGRYEDSLPAFGKAMELDPDSPDGFHDYALALARTGRINQAIALWQQTLKIKPSHTEARFGLAQALLLVGRDQEAIAQLRTAVAISPDRADILANLAWVLATDAVVSTQNGPEALQFARRACELTGNSDPICLDSLAAAQARTGDFSSAIQTSHLAEKAAARNNNVKLLEQITRRTSIYERGEAYTSGH